MNFEEMKPLTKIIIALIIPAVIVMVLLVMIFTSNNNNNNNSNNMIQIQEGLSYEIITDGAPDALVVEKGDIVFVDYEGRLSDKDGEVFDSSYNRGQPFGLQVGAGQVIEGWDLGLVGMKKGEIRGLTIAPELAYGERGSGDIIPGNSTLYFKVEIVEIEKAS
jgi:FKBP-type peptidyl-prolyl cis-trans isomerase